MSSNKLSLGIFSFVTGMFLIFILFEFDDLMILLAPISIVLIIAGSYLLRERISVIKPLIGGSILMYFGFGAIVVGLLGITESIDTIETDGLFIIAVSVILIIIGLPVLIGAVCAIIRKKHGYSLIGGIISIFIGIILDPLAVLLAIAALLLLFISEAEFEE